MNLKHFLVALAAAWGAQSALAAPPANPIPRAGCDGLPTHEQLRDALVAIVKTDNAGFGNHRWGVVVNRDGIVCAVAFSGPDRSAQWPGSRVIAAEKAATANALSLPNFALSTANLYWSSLPGQSLFSLATAAPPNPDAAYGGNPLDFGKPDDPMVGKPIGGIIVFGGGLALYDVKGRILGGLGVSGDTPCSDHIVAWKVRHKLLLDAVPMGIGPHQSDNMILDMQDGVSESGFGHPVCPGGKPSTQMIVSLPLVFPPVPAP